MTQPTKAQLETLLGTLQTAVASYNPPSSTSPDPNQDETHTKIQRSAIRTAAKSMLHAVTTPNKMSWTKIANLIEASTLYTVMNLGILAAIPETGSITRRELAERTHCTEGLLERLLRILVGTGMLGFIEEGNEGGNGNGQGKRESESGPRYTHTPFSLAFNDTTAPKPGTFFYTIYEVCHRPMQDLAEYFRSAAKARGEDLLRESDSNQINPFMAYYGTPDSNSGVWHTMALYPSMLQTFQTSMGSLNALVPPVGSFYDFSAFSGKPGDEERVQIVDVGGGMGDVLCEIIRTTPGLEAGRCVLQDVEGVVGLARAGAAGRMGLKTMVVDFHQEQPVKGALAYYMRFITHDYSDTSLLNILTHIADAMAPDSKLLIADVLMPDRLDESTLVAGVMDHLMLDIGGTERTERRFREVLGRVGIEVVRVSRVPGGVGGVIEGVKVKVKV